MASKREERVGFRRFFSVLQTLTARFFLRLSHDMSPSSESICSSSAAEKKATRFHAIEGLTKEYTSIADLGKICKYCHMQKFGHPWSKSLLQ